MLTSVQFQSLGPMSRKEKNTAKEISEQIMAEKLAKLIEMELQIQAHRTPNRADSKHTPM